MDSSYAYLPHGGVANPNGEPFAGTFFENCGVNPFIDTDEDHLSTFAIDVDTASYSVMRSYVGRGHLPPKDAVRTEEFVNYFKYYYTPPLGETFTIALEGAPSKFGNESIHKLLRIGIKGKEVEPGERKDATLTFVIDVSGSMDMENRLGLVKRALLLLLDQMRNGDRIGIVIYGSEARVITNPLPVEYGGALVSAINRLQAGGSTNAEEGIVAGYEMAAKHYRKGCINRVILCSDGVANVGRTGPEAILKQIKKYSDEGIYLSTIGFGMNNYNDVLMEKLADKGNGNYAYVDTIDEAKRVFVDNMTSTLQVIAKDVKIQVDFNPDVVRSYRLLGYENRDVADDKFRDDDEDGGEVGAGHCVTALYEIKLQKEAAAGKICTVHVRYEDPDSGRVTELTESIDSTSFHPDFESASADFRLAATAAEFAEILRESYWAKGSKLSDVLSLAKSISYEYGSNKDVQEFADLVSKAAALKDKNLADMNE
jgi:Ca-activated chloride channel family protein